MTEQATLFEPVREPTPTEILERKRDMVKILLQRWPWYTLWELWEECSPQQQEFLGGVDFLQGALMGLSRTEVIMGAERICRVTKKKAVEWKVVR